MNSRVKVVELICSKVLKMCLYNDTFALVSLYRSKYANMRCSNKISTFRILGLYSLSGKTARSREIGCYKDRIALKFNRHLGSSAAELPVKFQSDGTSLNRNLAASRLREILP